VDDLDSALHVAFSEVWGRISLDADEVRARLARRRGAEMSRPPRAWCLAVRAGDLRIEPYRVAIVPFYRDGDVEREEVTLDAKVLTRICAPVALDDGGECLGTVAEKLGVKSEDLSWARKAGVFRERKSRRFRGWTPVLYCDYLLDPSSPLRRGADKLWAWAWKTAVKRLPADFAQVVERRMLYRYVRGEPKARGWRWVCGGCRKLVRTIYLPLRDRNLAEYFGVKVEGDEVDEVVELPRTFACTRCHRVRYFSRVDRHGWNQLVAHATGGLLYGREVRKPEYWKETRRRAYRPSVRRAKSLRREEVRRLLLLGLGVGDVAKELGISVNGVNNHTRVIYREAGVHSYRELRRLAVGNSPCNEYDNATVLIPEATKPSPERT